MTSYSRTIASAILLVGGACAANVAGGGDDDDTGDGTGGSAGARTGGRGGGPGGASGSGAGGSGGSAPVGDGGRPPGDGGGLPPGAEPPPPPPGMMLSYVPPKVVISEFLYHPVMETSADEIHEFLEIANRTDQPVEIGGWRIAGTITFAFPAKLTLAAKQHLVIAKDPAAVAQVWALQAPSVLGPYTGELDNNGGTIAILDGAGATIDAVRYLDRAPWPIGADALGVGEAWLPAAMRPQAKHQYKGYSLERISYEISPNEPVNWTTSALDAATPGRPNGAAGNMQAIVESAASLSMADPNRRYSRPNEPTLVQVVFSARGMAKSPQLEYYVDNPEVTTPPATKMIPLAPAQTGFQTSMPTFPENSIVRYRVLADRGDGKMSVIGPRGTDPYGWYSHFVGADPPGGKSPAYFMFINRALWTRLWTNITPGRVAGGQCLPNPNWNAKVPAILVHDGRVYDVQVRYQGSPYNRMNGPAVNGFPVDKAPTQPAPLKALGWHISFPRYQPLPGGKRDLLLNKRSNECNFLRAGVGGMVFESVGLPSSQIGYARLYVNGAYLHFYSDFEHPDEDLLKRFFGKDHVVGDWFKAVGWNGEQGPYTWADGRDLTVTGCKMFTPLQLYTYNYDRHTPEWKTTSDEAMKMIKDFNAAKAAGTDALKRFFNEVFDYRLLLNYIAVINWMIPWDDFFQNHYLYRRSDGKWMFTPWDFDLMMGDFVSDADRAAGLTSAQSSFYIGELDDRSNRVVGVKWNNYIKDAFIKTYREELHQRLRELITKELSPAAFDAFIAKQLQGYDMAEASTSLSKAFCSPSGVVSRIKSFVTARNGRITAGLFR